MGEKKKMGEDREGEFADERRAEMKGNRKREAEGVSSENSPLGARNEEFLWGSFSDLSPLLILPPRLPSGDCVCFCTLFSTYVSECPGSVDRHLLR